ncbi:hypothetical protein OF83DRAFT_817663 [Amylostereum chailletii]|nr:hypothetical protein OF83DRAFT_817663 [Amylostereum chailletii]
MLTDFYAHVPPRCDSPAFIPAPLPVRPIRPNARMTSLNPSDAARTSSSVLPSPPPPTDSEAIQSLCRFFGVGAPAPVLASQLSRTHDLALLGIPSSARPTHVLAVYDAPNPDPHVLVTLIPVDLDLVSRRMRPDVFNHARPVTSPARSERPANPRALTVPVIPMHVPHASSAPLVLLFALGVRSELSDLVSSLLPVPAVEEWPAVPASARALAGCCDAEELARRTTFNQGVWKNVLVFGPQDERIMGVVQFVWNVTSEARKISSEKRR